MIDLLEFVIDAHGGFDRWSKVQSLDIQASIRGAVWTLKGRPNVLDGVRLVVDPEKENVTMTFPGGKTSSHFQPSKITLVTDNVATAFDDPETQFALQTRETPWQDVHVAYFSGEALWTYLTTPFLYAYPGFQTEEIDSRSEQGEIWRGLKVTFPDYVKSHTRQQVSFFGPDGLLRRHDYTVDILGGAPGANYASNYRRIDGLMFPMTRRVFGFEGQEHRVIPEPVLVSIDIASIIVNLKQ